MPADRVADGWSYGRCLTCGHVSCCDSSPGKHVRRPAHVVDHPIVETYRSPAGWRWCYLNETFV